MRKVLTSITLGLGLCALTWTGRAADPAPTLPSAIPALPIPGVVSTNSATNTQWLANYVPDDKYKLRLGDRIGFQILEDREAPKSLVVTDAGELDLPYVGRLKVADRTCKDIADEARKLLEKTYYYKATVIVAVDVANRVLGKVYIMGQVRAQGSIDLMVNEPITAGKAILRVGGFGDFANKKKVKLVRGSKEDGGPKLTFELNMIEILDEGKTEKDLTLQPDDFIIVPSRLINF